MKPLDKLKEKFSKIKVETQTGFVKVKVVCNDGLACNTWPIQLFMDLVSNQLIPKYKVNFVRFNQTIKHD